MEYEEKLSRLGDEDFFSFFEKMHAEPRWVTSAGHRSIQLLGICHHGGSHSAVFDPATLKVTCFSECGGGMLFHTWVRKILNTENPQEAKEFIEDWCDNQSIDFESRVPRNEMAFEYKERPFERIETPPIPGIPEAAIKDLYEHDFDNRIETLTRLRWHTDDGIEPEVMKLFGVAHLRGQNSVILPHHNINGQIVGIYERSYLALRRDVMKEYPECDWNFFKQFPRAKYVPLLKQPRFLTGEEGEKTSWSFPNTKNLYGLHLAHPGIKASKTAIIFEGGKSVMLAWQWDHRNTVATHTFGANPYHINMVLNCGAENVILAFDKQYESQDPDDPHWQLYHKRTYELAKKVKDYCNVYRLCDPIEGKLLYKDAPVDEGREYFEYMLEHKEPLFVDGVDMVEQVMSEEKEVKRTGLLSVQSRRMTDEEIEAENRYLIDNDLII